MPRVLKKYALNLGWGIIAKVQLHLSIEYELYQKAKEKIENLSGFIEGTLKEYLQIEDAGADTPQDVIELIKKKADLTSEIIMKRNQLTNIEKEMKKRRIVVVKWLPQKYLT